MTAEREAMTLERQAFEKWLDAKLSPFTTTAQVKFAWEGWQAAIANLSRAAEPVACVELDETSHAYVKWLCGIHECIGADLFTHPPEPARDADTWRKYCDDAAAEAIKKYAAKGDVEGAVLFMRITCGPPGKITQKEIDAAMAQESGE